MGKSLETSRLELHNKFLDFVDNAYFQPPESVRLVYPCIVYELYRLNQRFADDKQYRKLPCYSVTVIDKEQDIDWIDVILNSFEYCALERVYNADNLAHYSFILYYY